MAKTVANSSASDEGKDNSTGSISNLQSKTTSGGATSSDAVSSSDVKPEVVPFRVLSYNAFIRPSFAGFFAARYEWQDQRLTIFSQQHLHKYDIMLFQEAFKSLNWRMERWLNRWRKYFNLNVVTSKHHGFWRMLTRGERVGDAGLLIMTKHRIATHETYEFKCESHGMCAYAGKGVLYALVYPEGSTQGIHVFNTHLQATYKHNDFDKVSAIRAKQAVELVEYMKEKVHNNPDFALRGFPVMLGGDFNENARPRNNHGDRSSREDLWSTEEYVRLMKTLTTFTGVKPVDLVWENAKKQGESEHPITFADTTTQVRDQVCTESHFYDDKFVENSRLDYFFVWPGRPGPEHDGGIYDFDPLKIETVVHAFFIESLTVQRSLMLCDFA
jgi:endonuclease/exonuclease/phosphatase family metal-dependent hydrolase